VGFQRLAPPHRDRRDPFKGWPVTDQASASHRPARRELWCVRDGGIDHRRRRCGRQQRPEAGPMSARREEQTRDASADSIKVKALA
jgi:hypothetical protein